MNHRSDTLFAEGRHKITCQTSDQVHLVVITAYANWGYENDSIKKWAL